MEEFGLAFGDLYRAHRDVPLSVAEGLLGRRPELAKGKKAALAACQAALQQVLHAEPQEAAVDGVFALVLAKPSTPRGLSRWMGAKR